MARLMMMVLAAAAATVSAQLQSIMADHQQAYYRLYQDPYYTAAYPETYQAAYSQAYPGHYHAGQQGVHPAELQHLAYPDLQQTSYSENLLRPKLAATQPEVYSIGQEGDYQGASANPAAVPPPALDYTIATTTPVPIDSQYQALDEYGQYSFGFTGGDLGRHETRDAYGNVQGSYTYFDSDGKLQTQHYVADELGFRVIGSNLPKSPAVPSAAGAKSTSAPAVVTPPLRAVTDTPEVAAAKAAFVEAYNKAALAAAEAPDTR